MKRVHACIAVAAVAVAALGIGAAATAQAQDAPAGDAGNGKQRLPQPIGCFTCHGRSGQGGAYNGPAPRLAKTALPFDGFKGSFAIRSNDMPAYSEAILPTRTGRRHLCLRASRCRARGQPRIFRRSSTIEDRRRADRAAIRRRPATMLRMVPLPAASRREDEVVRASSSRPRDHAADVGHAFLGMDGLASLAERSGLRLESCPSLLI